MALGGQLLSVVENIMTKFEYQFIIAEKYGKGVFGHVLPKEVSWKVHYVNGEAVQNWTDMTLYNFLARIGEQGWEVTAMTSHTIIRTGTLPVEHLYITAKRIREGGAASD